MNADDVRGLMLRLLLDAELIDQTQYDNLKFGSLEIKSVILSDHMKVLVDNKVETT